MLKKKIVKIALVLACIMTLLMPYASTVLAVALTQESETAELQVLRVHKGGEESSGTLNESQRPYYDETPYGYRVGDTRVFKIIVKGDVEYENAFYCLNAKKSFPGVTNSGYNVEAFTNVADLKDPTDPNVKALHLSTSNSKNSSFWTSNYKALVWLVDNMYLPTQTPEQKDDYLAKAFAGTEEDLELVKALLTDDDIDVVQQYAMWYFTNRDSLEFNVTTLPAVTLTKYELAGTTTKEITGSYGDMTPGNFPEELSYSLRQDFANELYQYLIKSAEEAVQTSVTFPAIVETPADYQVLKVDGFYGVGPFKVTSGTAQATEYTLKLVDQDGNVIPRDQYEILIENQNEFTNKNVNEIFDVNYNIYLPTTNKNITKIKLVLEYANYETEASLWKNTKTNEDGVEIYQPLTLITREKTPHKQDKEYEIDRKTSDLALRKYIVKINDETVNRAPNVDVSGLKNGTSQTATYKHAKTPIEVSNRDTVVYEIRVYNEADIDGVATLIYDALPKGLEFVEDSEINRTYGWEVVAYGENRTVYKTAYLANETIEAFDKENGNTLNSAYVQIECKIADDAVAASVLTNVAEIGDDNIDDRDSQPTDNSYVKEDLDSTNYTGDKDNKSDLTDNEYYYKGIEDDDDFEKVVVKGKAFDMSLQKFISKVNKNAPSINRAPQVDVTYLKNGTTIDAMYTTVKTPVKVKKGDIVTYTIRVYNEGEVAGYAEEVSDYLPESLGFLVNHTTNVDNYWSIPEDCNIVKLSTIENGTKNLSIDDFSGITDLSNVDVVTGKVKLTSTKLKSSETDTRNLIDEFDKETDTTLDYKDIQIACIVLSDKVENDNGKNIAEIAKETNENREVVVDRDSTPNTVDPDNYPGDDNLQDDNDYENITIEKEPETPPVDPEPEKEFDLSLQKFITSVNNTKITDRVPTITKNNDGTLRFNHNSNPLAVCYNDYVTFTIRVYNEGDIAGYAKEVVDYLPDSGLEFVLDNSTNERYGWELYDANGNKTNKISQAVTARTKYLSKEEAEKRNDDCLINPFDETKALSNTNPDYEELQIVFKVTAKGTSSTTKKEYINIAEIADDEDENGKEVDDKDSTPNNKKDGEDDKDQDKIYVKYFDLSLDKKLIKIIITENGTTREIDVSKTDALQKVEIHRKRINSTVVKFVYRITVTNEGEIAGYATEIKDYIPQGLEFRADENKEWTKESDNVITTNALAETLLEPGKSASVQVTLRWINGDENFGVKTNVAEISEDKNDSGTPDIDSTPDNKKSGEDDIDDAEVMLSISTGVATPKYTILTTSILVILATGIALIKKYVLY